MIVAIPVVKAGDKYHLSPHFGRAPYFAIVEVRDGKYEIREIVENPHANHERGKGEVVINLLQSRNVEAVVAMNMGYRIFEKLRSRGIKIYTIPEEASAQLTIEELAEMLAKGRLKEAERPRNYFTKHTFYTQ